MNGLDTLRASVQMAVVGLLIVSIDIVGVSVASAGEPGIKPPAYAIEVGHHHQEGGDSWELWIYGNSEGRRCWFTGVRQEGTPTRYETCGYSVPRRRWELASKGPVGEGSRRETVLFFLTRPHLAKLSVLMKTRVGRRRIVIPVHTVGAVAARKARLRGGVGYAVARITGATGRVIAVDVIKQ